MKNRYGNALTAAAFDGTIDIVKKLIAAGADVNSLNGWPLHAAAAGGHLAVVAELLSQGAEINRIITKGHRKTVMMRGGTALQSACEAGKREVVNLLLQHGADPNLGPKSGSGAASTCPLIVASRKGEFEIFKSLIQAGAAVDVFGGPERTTPLINAAISLPREAIESLLERGANINLPDKTVGDTALIVASRKGDAELASCLLERGADILHTNRRGENALQAAALASREMCLTVLVNHVSCIMTRLKTAIDSGNKTVERIVNGVEEEVKAEVRLEVKEQVVEEAKKEGSVGGQVDKEKELQTTTNNQDTKETRPTEIKVIPENDAPSKIVVIPDNDDSSKIVATVDDDMPDYMVETFADMDDLGIPIALPSLGLPHMSFSAPAPPPPAASPSPPPPRPASPATTVTSTQTEDVAAAPNLTYRPPQDIRAWTPDSEPFHGKGAPRSRSASPVITILTRRKPAPGARKNTVTFSSADQEGRASESSDHRPSVSHTPKASLEQDVPVRIQLTDSPVPTQSRPPLSDSPQAIQSPFVPPAPSRAPSPPKQAPQQQASAPRRDTATSVTQPPAYAALVAANFRSQSQPQPSTQPLIRPSPSSGALHQPGHSSSPSYSLRSLYSIPPASSSVVSSPPISPAQTTPSLVSHGSSASITTLASNPIQQQQIQQQRDVYKQKIEAYSSFHGRPEGKTHSPIPHQKSFPTMGSPGWTMQVGNETVEQPVAATRVGMGGERIGGAAKRMSVPVMQGQIPVQLQSPPQEKMTDAASFAPKITSPPASYDGEGWGDSPVDHHT